MSLFYFCFWKLASECRAELLILSLCCDLLQFMPSKEGFTYHIWQKGNKAAFKEVALYIALFLRASLLCFHLSLDVVIMKRMRLTHTQPLFSSPLFPAQWYSQEEAGGWGGRHFHPINACTERQTKGSLLCIWTQAGAHTKSSQATFTPERDHLLHTRVSWGSYIQNMG